MQTRGRFNCGEEYHERHHIVPRCLDGSNDKDNLIDLFAREHFIAHKLLAIENPDNQSLQYAWWMMAHIKKGENCKSAVCSEFEYEEAKKAVHEKCSGENSWNWGRVMSEETKDKISKSMQGEKHPLYGKHHTEESRKKISKNHANVKKENNPNYGKMMSEEQRQKISKANKGKTGLKGERNGMYGKHHTDEAKQKLSDRFSGEKNPQSRPVMCVETGEIFWGAMEVQRKLGINHTNVGLCCHGRRKTAGGYHWTFVEKAND